ncbi:hypothetical protein R4P64_03360 [Rhodococcus sp. IEGM 1366]|uniref:helix-turn-helix domain-containing protein n=1 Tax=Rhodococcus sp. IEGM 1366 TaxID=3082223 RepID=UPI0029530365|nr:helix-turn-helix domain-containing protein [Rhodococcus sp. IEGM 1366]MDV8065536.1 hypothetical protein [Rhodococcus sp. IEGM 1366]
MSGRSLNKFAWMEALRGADLTHAEYRVLLNLSTFARGDLTNAHPGLPKLCEAAGVSVPTAKKALRVLVAKGWLVLTEEGGNKHWKGKANVYSLSIPKGVSDLPPWGAEKGENRDHEGGKPFSEGDKSAPPEGGNSLTPHQEVLTGDYINEGDHLSSYVSIARDEEPPQKEVQFIEERQAPAPGFAAPAEKSPSIDPDTNPLAWIDNALHGGFKIGEREEAQRMLDEGVPYGPVRWRILDARKPMKPLDRLRKRREFIDDSPAQPSHAQTGAPNT